MLYNEKNQLKVFGKGFGEEPFLRKVFPDKYDILYEHQFKPSAFSYCSSFLMPKITLRIPDMNFGLLITTIFNVCTSLDDIFYYIIFIREHFVTWELSQ